MLKIINCIKFSKLFCPYIQKFDFSKYSSFRSEKLESKKEQLFYKKEKKILNNERASIKSTKFFSQFQRTYKINDKNIFSMFLQNQFLAYMRSTYSLLPFLFSINLLNNFRFHFQNSDEYKEYVISWFDKNLNERLKLVNNQSIKFPMFSNKKFSFLRPFLELYLKYLEEFHSEDVRTSQKLAKITDLRDPHNWYPEARAIKRKLIYHHGPTNSGKTYSALLDLEKSEKGIYCAPLRLLAWEIQEKLESKGIACNLITGQEKLNKENAKITSCTVECANLSEKYDMAIIDEIQMIGDNERGSAWTNALLGLKSDVIHLCGDERALGLINKICEITGDELIEKSYERFSNLYLEKGPFRISKDLKPGDCLITFSVRDVHKMKNSINKIYGNSKTNLCSVIYGRLPPENRKDQTKRFNDQSDVHYLVATNAIGMGVNLKIKRIIFTGLMRMTSEGKRKIIPDYEIRQIAGRAGRFKEDGLISYMNPKDADLIYEAIVNNKKYDEKKEDKFEESEESDDLEELSESEEDDFKNLIQRELKFEETIIKKAGLFPSFTQLESFSRNLENIEGRKIQLSEICRKFVKVAQLEELYFIQKFDEFCEICDFLENCNLNMNDQFNFAQAPLNMNKEWKKIRDVFKKYAIDYSAYNHVKLPFLFNEQYFTHYQSINEKNLSYYEELHHILDVYLWLANKFKNVFSEENRARKLKEEICQKIDFILDNLK